MTGITMKQIPKFLCILMIVGANVVSSVDVQNILSKLYQKAVQTNRPLVVVLDNSHDEARPVSQSNSLGLNSYLQSPRLESGHSHSIHHPRSQNRVKSAQNKDRGQNRISLQSSRPESSESSALQILYLLKELQVRESLEKQRIKQKSLLRQQLQQQNQQAVLSQPILPAAAPVLPLEAPSPIVKHLLRLRNSLRCGKKAQCENSCRKVSKKYSCSKKCAELYTCTEVTEKEPEAEVQTEEPEDQCEIGDDCESKCDSCETQHSYSTKALEVGEQENDK